MSDLRRTADAEEAPRRRSRRARDQHRLALAATTDLGVPVESATSPPTRLVGRWNVLDRGVRPLVVRSDGTFTLFDHGDGRTDGRWLRVSDTFVSLFVDGPRRHSMYSMPDGRVFLSRYAPPGSVSTPELLFRSVLSFEGTWETPYRDSPRTPAPPTQMSLGADRTFCVDLGHRGGPDGSVVVWSGIWARTSDTSATLDYVVWEITDGARRMAGHAQTTLDLKDDGTLTVAALDDVFYPAPGTVRAEGDEPLATAAEPDVLLCPLAVDEPEKDEPEDGEREDDGPEEGEPEDDDASGLVAEQARDDAPESPSDQDGTVADLPAGTETAPAQRRRVRHRATRPEGPPAGQSRTSWRDAVVTVEMVPSGQPGTRVESPASQRDVVVTVEMAGDDRAEVADPAAASSVRNGAVVPLARVVADDGTPVVVVLFADADGVLQVGALPAPTDEVVDRVPSGSAAELSTPLLPVAGTTVDETPVVVVLYVDEHDVLQVGAVPASLSLPAVASPG